MSDKAFRLSWRGGSWSGPIELGPNGLTFELDVPQGRLLERAELRIEAPADSLTLPLMPTLTTSKGAHDGKSAVDWISADWGVRRPVVSLQIKWKAAPPNTAQPSKALLKVAEGGPWFPPLPFDKITPKGEKIQLSGVTGTRLLIEAIEEKPNDKFEKISAIFESLAIEVAARPPDLIVSVGENKPFFHHPMLLDPQQEVVLRDELTAALQRAWPADLCAGRISLTLRSSAESKLQSVKWSLVTTAVFRTWAGGTWSTTLDLDAGEFADAVLPESPQGNPKSLVLSVQTRARPERPPQLVEPLQTPLTGHLVGSNYRAAQAFAHSASQDLLVGLDILVKPLTSVVRGTIAVHADANGRPADAPMDAAIAEFVAKLETSATWERRWVHVDFPAPIAVPEGMFWVVLDVSEGEALWPYGHISERSLEPTSVPAGAAFRAPGDRVWRERSSVAPPFACTRLRFYSTKPPPPPTIEVTWGKTKVSANLGRDGRVLLDEQVLATLKRPTTEDTRMRVRVLVQVRASVTLSNLELQIRQPADGT